MQGRWLNEPLIHFFAIGALLFAVVSVVPSDSPDIIVVSDDMRTALAADFETSHGRAPSPEELEARVREYVTDEALYREAKALGLDRSDPIVRRRLIQRMRFVIEDLHPPTDPAPPVLQAWLDTHPDAYTRPARVALEQVFIASDRHDDAQAVARRWWDRLRAGEDVSGDASAHGRQLPPLSEPELRAKLGAGVAKAAFTSDATGWLAPTSSAHGLHIVRVTERLPTAVPTLGEVRPAVLRDWRDAEARRLTDEAVARIASRYEVEDGR